jgi:predicted amidohydrolase
MLVRWRDDGTVSLENDGVLVAEAAKSELELDVPAAPDQDAAEAAGMLARKAGAQETSSPYARCFSCGSTRSDGLRIVPGPVGEDGIVATTWIPPSFAADANGQLCVEAAWSALDCSAGFAWMRRLAAGTPIITARMTAVVDQPLQAGRRYTVIGWPIAQDGRKLHAGTAIFDRAGKIQARSRQLWLIQRA